MNPFPALVKETRYCSGADLKTLKEQLEGRSPAFPAPGTCSAVVPNSLCLGPGLVSSGGFGVPQGDSCSCQRADREAASAGNFL